MGSKIVIKVNLPKCINFKQDRNKLYNFFSIKKEPKTQKVFDSLSILFKEIYFTF